MEQNKLSKTGSRSHFCSQRNRLDQGSRKDYLPMSLGKYKNYLGKLSFHLLTTLLSLFPQTHIVCNQPLSCWFCSSFCKCTQRFILMSSQYSYKMLVINIYIYFREREKEKERSLGQPQVKILELIKLKNMSYPDDLIQQVAFCPYKVI